MSDRETEVLPMLWTFGEGANPRHFERFARMVESGGFDGVVVGDHLTIPAEIPNEYPFSSSGEPPAVLSSTTPFYEAFSTLSYVAGLTDDLRVGTNMCVAPLRHPVALTKQALTLDALVDGRLDLGVAIGWLSTEYEVVGVPFEERGSRLDEFLEVFTRAREAGVVAHDGEHYEFQETGFYPAPESDDRPAIWVGGRSSPALRRTAAYGDGFVTVWDEPNELATYRDRLLDAWTDHDRDGEPRVAITRAFHVGHDTDRDTDHRFMGDPAGIVQDVSDYVEAGATRVILDFFTGDPDEQLRQLERFADDVLPDLP